MTASWVKHKSNEHDFFLFYEVFSPFVRHNVMRNPKKTTVVVFLHADVFLSLVSTSQPQNTVYSWRQYDIYGWDIALIYCHEHHNNSTIPWRGKLGHCIDILPWTSQKWYHPLPWKGKFLNVSNPKPAFLCACFAQCIVCLAGNNVSKYTYCCVHWEFRMCLHSFFSVLTPLFHYQLYNNLSFIPNMPCSCHGSPGWLPTLGSAFPTYTSISQQLPPVVSIVDLPGSHDIIVWLNTKWAVIILNCAMKRPFHTNLFNGIQFL